MLVRFTGQIRMKIPKTHTWTKPSQKNKKPAKNPDILQINFKLIIFAYVVQLRISIWLAMWWGRGVILKHHIFNSDSEFSLTSYFSYLMFSASFWFSPLLSFWIVFSFIYDFGLFFIPSFIFVYFPFPLWFWSILPLTSFNSSSLYYTGSSKNYITLINA